MFTAAETDALLLSLRVALLATVASLPAGVLVAWVLERTRMPGRLLLDTFVSLPLVLPPVVTGYLLLLVFARGAPLGLLLERYLGISVAFTWLGAALAAAVVAFPLLVRAVRISLASIEPGLESAARTLGAGPLRVFFGITLPLSLPGLLAGAMLAFARSVGEFGATVMLAGNIAGRTRTLPLAIYTAAQRPDGQPQALRLVVISVVVSFVALALSEWMVRRAAAAKREGG